eukprot:TRINITY_DN2556_c0_g1_i4.p1 TRINITY_DN2556_c0_g1~~TRINITY_DN2556_c0_g1_i4.p1  ORF type:complete len:414 (-),score=41.42 TRINITY_DN2556_c0_g1_i4:1255-2496(-)
MDVSVQHQLPHLSPVCPDFVAALLTIPGYYGDPELIKQQIIPGSSSQIVFLQHQQYGSVAVKVIETTDAYGRAISGLDECTKQEMKRKRPKWTARELLNLLLVQGHPGVIQVKTTFFYGPDNHKYKYFYIVMEKAQESLENFIARIRLLRISMQESRQVMLVVSEAEARPIMQQIVCIVHYLHRQGVVHRDIKAANCLLFRQDSSPNQSLMYDRVKIADFGFSKHRLSSKQTSKVGTLPYAAPEILARSNKPYEGCKVDVWSLGILLHYLLFGFCPFGPFPDEAWTKSLDFTISQRVQEFDPFSQAYLQQLTPCCQHLLQGMLQKDPNVRIGILEVKNHPWIQNDFSDSLAERLERMVNYADVRATHVEDPNMYKAVEERMVQIIQHNLEHPEEEEEVTTPQHVVDAAWDFYG